MIASSERWLQIARATVTAVVDDHFVGLAAQLAFYFLLYMSSLAILIGAELNSVMAQSRNTESAGTRKV